METNPHGRCIVAGCVRVADQAVRLFEGITIDGADASTVIRFCAGHEPEAVSACRLLTGDPGLELRKDGECEICGECREERERDGRDGGE